ncbi:mitogen-activated protein kinase kinase kinase [Trifolium repens]|nr:mitogen-activated protein kinase kinase kinase [Trifolium repens]
MYFKKLLRKPKYERRDALKLFNYDAQSSFSSFESSSSVYTCSTDLNDRTSFRIDGIEGDFDQNCRSLRLSGREDFANPAAASWEAMKFPSSSYILPRLKIEEIDLQQKEEDELSEKCEDRDRDRDSVRVTYEVALTVVGICQPMIKPPPRKRVRVVDNMCSTWELLKELGPVVEGDWEEWLLEAGFERKKQRLLVSS